MKPLNLIQSEATITDGLSPDGIVGATIELSATRRRDRELAQRFGKSAGVFHLVA